VTPAAQLRVARELCIVLTDHKVAQRNAPEIKRDAIGVRNKIFGDKVGSVRAANAILKLTRVENKNGERLKLEFRSAAKIGAAAVVSYSPLKIEFDRAVWTKALLSNDADANYIAAHELGHLILHNHHAQPYSGVKKGWISFNEESAEWQANKFADYFLVLDEDVYRYISPAVIAEYCQVPKDLAERRFLELATMAECSCSNCFSTKVYRLNCDHYCWNCGHSFL
jgi:hypothetical protein